MRKASHPASFAAGQNTCQDSTLALPQPSSLTFLLSPLFKLAIGPTLR